MRGKQRGPRVLFLDIETAPILGYVWSLWQQDVALNQIKQDWFILAWAAKWQGEDDIIYFDQRKSRYIERDKNILKPLWKLLDEATHIVTQNGKKFDEKKINARFAINGMKPPSGYKHIDTKQLASKKFGFTSNKLEYLADKLGVKVKKSQHKKFPGFELWRECLARNLEAWEEMEAYNKDDVLALEGVYNKLSPWDTTTDFNAYHEGEDFVCQCGHPAFLRYGYAYTAAGRYQRFRCKQCGALYRGRENLLTREKRMSLRRGGSV